MKSYRKVKVLDLGCCFGQSYNLEKMLKVSETLGDVPIRLIYSENGTTKDRINKLVKRKRLKNVELRFYKSLFKHRRD